MADQKGQAYAKTEWLKISKLTRTETQQRFVNLFKEGYEGLRSKIGVFSLSFIPDSELMWSHYAPSHSGYVLHFQIAPTTYYIDPSLKSEIHNSHK